VVWTVKKYYVPDGLTFMDLVQEGNLGLHRSIEKWDYRRGHRFSTYSTWWIRQAIDRGLSTARQVRFPEHMRLQVQKLRREIRKFNNEHGRAPRAEEMAERLNMTPEKYAFVAQQLGTRILSLDAPIKSDEKDGSVFMDMFSEREFVKEGEGRAKAEPIRGLVNDSLQRGIQEAIQALPEREAFVIKKRFGLDGGKMHTLQEVGNLMGITRERVRQIEGRTMRSLKSSKRTQIRRLLIQQMQQYEALDDALTEKGW